MKRINIKKWNTGTMLFTCSTDVHDPEIQKTSIDSYFLQRAQTAAFEEAPYTYEIDGELYSTCYECLVRYKIKVCRRELDGLTDSIRYAINELKSKL